MKLMCILAHPDDESLGMGGILAKYAAEGIETYLVTATRGERGWFGDAADYPGPTRLGQIRQAELAAAASVLGLREVNFLGYQDGDLDQADPDEAIAKIVAHLRRIRPQVVVTFDPWGIYGHPDHIAISQLATSAAVAAANPAYDRVDGLPHQVSKLYYRAVSQAEQNAYEVAFGELIMTIDGVERRTVSWPEWSITTCVDTSAYSAQVWEAVACHQSQLPGYEALRQLPAKYHEYLWGKQTYYRAFSTVNGGREVERDLFAGLRQTVELPVGATLSNFD